MGAVSGGCIVELSLGLTHGVVTLAAENESGRDRQEPVPPT
jgi:hypothetical protein